MSALAPVEPISAQYRKTELWFRRVLFSLAAVALLCAVFQFGVMLWADNSFTGPESVVAAQSMMLARNGTLYYALNGYPYTVSAYMPIFYLLEAGLYKFGLPAYTAGRIISFLALLGLSVLCWRIVLLYTGDRYCAGMAALFCASSCLLLSYGTVGQVDMLAVFWGITAFYQCSRYLLRGEKTLLWAGLFAVLAFFTKQTMIALPATLCLLLSVQRRKVALQFGIAVAGAIVALFVAIDASLHGRFLADTVLANLNPFSLGKVWPHLMFMLATAGPLFLVAAAGARPAIRTGLQAPFAYLAAALLVFALTAPKIGSDVNYQIEFTVVLILCASVALHGLDFFALSFAGNRTWITLLQVPVALFLVGNCKASFQGALGRVAGEQMARTSVAELRPYLFGGGRVISADYNAMTRIQQRITVEMLIYKLLVDGRVVNPEPVRRDLAAGAFSTVVLFEDVNHRDRNLDAELSTLPESQLDEIMRHYRLVKRVNGFYVYQPAVPPAYLAQ